MPEESDGKPERSKSAPKPAEKPAPSADGRMSPREHALATGNGPKKGALATGNGPKKGKNVWTGPGFSRQMGSEAHEIAKQLHGWDDHEHETGKPIQLTRDEYLAALKAALPADEIDANGVVTKLAGNPKPHPAALSPYKGQRGRVALGKQPEGKPS